MRRYCPWRKLKSVFRTLCRRILQLTISVLAILILIAFIQLYTSHDSRIALLKKDLISNLMKETYANDDVMHLTEATWRHRASRGTPNSSQPEPVNCTFLHHRLFPLCMEKVDSLKVNWRTDKCFHEVHKVDGSQCSYFNYLTKIEPYCLGKKGIYRRPESAFAKLRYDWGGFLRVVSNAKFWWWRKRGAFMWKSWVNGAKKFSSLRLKYKQKRIIIYPRSLLDSKFLEQAGQGGPLGEMIQWTDLVTALYFLGHDITIVEKSNDFMSMIKGNSITDCASGKYEDLADVIYSDIIGVKDFEYEIGSASFAKFRCLFRVLDVFGTFAEYNYPNYPHKIPGGRSEWGDLNLILTQVLTMYPHTNDNSFLGFVIPNITKKSRKKYSVASKKTSALLYAKDSKYLTRSTTTRRYLDIISEYFEIHATMRSSGSLPKYVYNHGSVSVEKVQELLSQSKLFIGVGHPFEGPGPLEAMANGAVYIQPRFDVAVEDIWKGKPTLRNLHSQNPYMEEFVGEPYCYTLDVGNETLLRKTLQRIKDMKRLPGKIRKEFTNQGMLERVHVFTQKTDFCDPYAPRWPPINNLHVHYSLDGQSCKDTCMSKGLVCERTYFDEINTAKLIEKHSNVTCSETKHKMLLHAPSMDVHTQLCYVQAHAQVFSCMHEQKGVARLCPCRDYENEQSAICKNCL